MKSYRKFSHIRFIIIKSYSGRLTWLAHLTINRPKKKSFCCENILLQDNNIIGANVVLINLLLQNIAHMCKQLTTA